MTGIQFYNFLRLVYNLNGQPLFGNYSFREWILKPDGTYSFQFNGNHPLKSVPKNWIVDAKDAKNAGERINRNWFNNFYNAHNFNDCRASIAIWLLDNHD